MTSLLSRVHRGLFFAVVGLMMMSTIAPALTVAQESTPEADASVETTTEATEAPVAQGVPWAQPIDYGVVVNNFDVGGLPAEGLAVRSAPSPDAEVLGRIWEGQRVEVTSAETWSGNTPYITINYGNGGGYVNAYFVQLDSQAPAVTEVPVVTEEPVVTEVPVETAAPVETQAPVETVAPVETQTAEPVVPTEVVTEAAPTEEAAETIAPTEGSPAPTNVVEPIGTIPADGAATETPSEDLTTPAQGTPVDQPGESATATATAPATEEAPATPAATETESAPETAAATEPAGTPAGTATAPEGTPVASETAAATETPAGPDVSKAIGSATVTGTNGEGIRCRISPDDNAATIVVLTEGTVVSVFDTSVSGWLQISCGGQLGYGDINYLYTGGASDDQINQGGRLTVSGTGGGGVNCRSGAGTNYGIVALISEGTALTIRGQAANGWTPVTCNGQNGYVYSQYIAVSAVTDGGGTSGSATAGTAKVTGTNGDGVRCRTAASTSSTVIMVVTEGTAVSVRGASSNGWTPVTCGGRNGYISSTYLGSVTATTPTATATKTATATSVPGGSTGTGWVTVSGSGGGVNCRTGAGTTYGVITVVAEGAKLQTRSGSTNGWQAVICGGKNGFILGELTSPTSGSGTGTTPTPTATATATSTPGGGSGSTGTAVVANTGGDGVYCRASAPSGSPITILAEGTTVTLRGTANNGWQPVICGGQNGFVSSQYLSLSSGGGSTTPTPNPGTGSGLANGDHAKTTAVVNLRYSPSMSGAIAMSVEIGIVVQVTGTASGGFYPISYDGLNGWIHGDYLVKTSDALSVRGGSGNPGTTPTATTVPGGGGGGSATGNALVSFAMGYLGYPYVSATHGPASFDCSGFTYWVVYNVTGQNIWYGLWTQISAGVPVDRGSLQPGDLVFFQNTYQAGLSHVGIYIGGDQFIHAENEDTGVRISSLSSTYYSSRYYGARRIG